MKQEKQAKSQNNQNQRQAVALLHQAQILKAAERLFAEKGFHQTAIADISTASGYSRRTICANFESKTTFHTALAVVGDCVQALPYNEPKAKEEA